MKIRKLVNWFLEPFRQYESGLFDYERMQVSRELIKTVLRVIFLVPIITFLCVLSVIFIRFWVWVFLTLLGNIF